MVAITEQRLIKKNINPTAMRLLVLDFLLKQHAASSLTDIEKALSPADRVTIYRTLRTFEGKGLVHTIDDGTGAPKYAACVDECNLNEHHDMHVHFSCMICKETFCLPDSKIPAINLPDKFSSLEMKLVVKGICSQCTK